MNIAEKVAALTAVQKALESELKAAREELHCWMVDSDSERTTLRIGDIEVGKATRRMPKAEPEIFIQADFEEFALEYGLASERKAIDPAYMPEVIRMLEDEMPEAVKSEAVLDSAWKKRIQCRGGSCYLEDSDLEVPGLVPMLKPEGLVVTGCKPEDVVPLIKGATVSKMLEE